MEILMLEPTIKSAIWGGRQLIDDFGFETGCDNAAEAWLLSCHKDGPSFVCNGKYAGKTLAEALEAEGTKLLGTHGEGFSDFPVLIKIIDARDKLSIQVHPGDEYARLHENENGKTEAWYIISAKPGAKLIYGVNHDMTALEFAESIKNSRLLENLNTLEVKAGDIVFIPSGRLHAIGEGILLAEVQQSSNTTYRVFDYERRDKDGKLRELHLEKALQVLELSAVETNFSAQGEKVFCDGAVKRFLVGCKYFNMTELEIDGLYRDKAENDSFVSLLALNGEGELIAGENKYKLKKGSSVFIPAGFGCFSVSGKLLLLETRI